jgi:hypothetical protein
MTTITTVVQTWSGDDRGYVELEDCGVDIKVFCNDANPDACEVHLKLWRDQGEEGDGPVFAGTRQECVDWADTFQTDPPADLAGANALLAAYAARQ